MNTETAELDLREYLETLHRAGLNWWQILRILLILSSEAHFRADAEYYKRQH